MTLLLLKQRELTRQETLCSGNSMVVVVVWLLAFLRLTNPSNPLFAFAGGISKAVFLQGTSNPLLCSETRECTEMSASIIELDTRI